MWQINLLVRNLSDTFFAQQSLVLRITRNDETHYLNLHRQGRQDGNEEEEAEDPVTSAPSISSSLHIPTLSPYIPAVIPALTKIFTGIITGNINEIFHGSTSFAPQNISFAIDSVYNQVVGLAPPLSTPGTSSRPFFGLLGLSPTEVVTEAVTEPPTEPEPLTSTPEPPKEIVTEAAIPVQSDTTIAPGQPLEALSVVITSTTAKATSNEDDEDENDVDLGESFGFRRLKRKNEVAGVVNV